MRSLFSSFRHSFRTISQFPKERGTALLITLFIFMSASVGILLSSSIALVSELRLYRSLASSKSAYLAAESGIEDAVYRQINGMQLSSSESIHLNDATSTLSTNTISADEMEFTVVGDSDDRYRRLFAGLRRTSSQPFQYAAQIGEGGITMGVNSGVNGLALAEGHIYSNGAVIGASGVTVTGDVSVASHIVPDVFASSTTCTADELVGKTSPNIDYAQQFEPTSTDTLVLVSLYLKRVGSPTGGTVRITTDSAGVPSTTSLVSQTLSYSLVSTSYGWVDVIFSSPPLLTAGTKYWIVFDATANATKYWTWCRSSSSTYASGTPAFKNPWNTAGAWTAVTGDMAFKTAYGFGVSKLDTVTVLGTAKADTIVNANISGDAYYQSLTGGSVGGTLHPSSPTPPKVSLPLSTTTIQAWKDEATAGGVITGNKTVSGTETIGPKKITGNLTVEGAKHLKLSGTLYVVGNIFIEDNGYIECAASYGANSCIVIADGNIVITNNGHTAGSGDPSSFIMMLTTIADCNGPGSIGTGCAPNQSGISLTNNVDSALFYTGSSMVDVSDNVTLTAVVAYKLSLSSNAYVVYDDKLSALNFSSGMTSSGPWLINNWREIVP